MRPCPGPCPANRRPAAGVHLPCANPGRPWTNSDRPWTNRRTPSWTTRSKSRRHRRLCPSWTTRSNSRPRPWPACPACPGFWTGHGSPSCRLCPATSPRGPWPRPRPRRCPAPRRWSRGGWAPQPFSNPRPASPRAWGWTAVGCSTRPSSSTMGARCLGRGQQGPSTPAPRPSEGRPTLRPPRLPSSTPATCWISPGLRALAPGLATSSASCPRRRRRRPRPPHRCPWRRAASTSPRWCSPPSATGCRPRCSMPRAGHACPCLCSAGRRRRPAGRWATPATSARCRSAATAP
mmetsp:Transcript_65456/g.188596  ORF Transcript_65456/g.188596 Transcript_65456/m.188596 type:complete len:292 (+) Transcript_65456:406-1281(+)